VHLQRRPVDLGATRPARPLVGGPRPRRRPIYGSSTHERSRGSPPGGQRRSRLCRMMPGRRSHGSGHTRGPAREHRQAIPPMLDGSPKQASRVARSTTRDCRAPGLLEGRPRVEVQHGWVAENASTWHHRTDVRVHYARGTPAIARVSRSQGVVQRMPTTSGRPIDRPRPSPVIAGQRTGSTASTRD
jgi:hypothetical protein